MTRRMARGTVPLVSLRKGAPEDPRLEKPVNSDRDWFRIVNKVKDDATTEIFIYDEIGMWGTNAQDFVKQMMAIDTPKIDLHLNSPGGEIFDGVAIYNALKVHSATVTVYIDSLAASAASFIAQAGDSVVMTRNATMMIHDAGAFCAGDMQDMLDTADILNKLSNNIADIYAQRAGGTVADWRAFMQEETWYNADEAVAAGLADLVSGEGVKAENKWNLTIFNHAGRSDAPSPDKVRERVLSNRVKEAHMSKTPEEIAAEAAAVTAAEEAATVAAVAAKKLEDEAAAKKAADEAAEAATSAAAKLASSNKMFVNINGVPTSDLSVINTYIASLEGFQNETKSSARKNFVAGLATSNKIGAAQVTGMETFVATLSDEQYEGWTATWNAAVTLPLLGMHGGSSTNLNGDDPEGKVDKLELATAIVNQHKRAGMATDTIKATESYNTLIALNPTFKL